MLWQGHLIDVVLITWNDGRYRLRYHWIVADETYLKELFVASMVHWVSTGANSRMDEVLMTQTELLCSQMNAKKESESKQ